MTDQQVTNTTENVTVNNDKVISPVVTEEVKTEEIVAPVEKTEAQKKEEKSAARFAELAKRERKIYEREQKVKEKASLAEQYEKNISKAKENPIQYLQELTGAKFEDILNQYIGLDNNESKDKQEDPKYKRIEEKLSAFEKAEKDRQEAAQKQENEKQWQQHVNVVSQYVEKNSEKYEVIMTHPQRALSVYQELLNTAIQTAGRGLDEDEVIAVLNRTEDLLTDELKPLYEKLSKTKKFAPFIKFEPEKPIVTETLKPKTLTNNLNTSAITSAKKKETDVERLARIKSQFG